MDAPWRRSHTLIRTVSARSPGRAKSCFCGRMGPRRQVSEGDYRATLPPEPPSGGPGREPRTAGFSRRRDGDCSPSRPSVDAPDCIGCRRQGPGANAALGRQSASLGFVIGRFPAAWRLPAAFPMALEGGRRHGGPRLVERGPVGRSRARMRASGRRSLRPAGRGRDARLPRADGPKRASEEREGCEPTHHRLPTIIPSMNSPTT